MIPARNGADVLSRREKEVIHRNVLRVLAEVGLQIEHDGMLEHLALRGFPVERTIQRVRFPADTVEGFLARSPKTDWATRVPVLAADAEVYASRYLEPGTDRLVEWTPELLRAYAGLVRLLPEARNFTMLGCPYRAPAALHPLYERIEAWRFGAVPGGSIHPLGSSDALWDLVQTYAALKGRKPADVFNGVCFMMSPLRLAAEECKQFWYWYQKGMALSIGDMPTAGSSTPVTLAGHVTMQLGERLALLMLQEAFFGQLHGYIGSGMGACDMKTLIRPFGRPEMPIANAMIASMARHYQMGVFGHSGLTDAKLPCEEVGAQKVGSALATLLTGADGYMAIGLLSLDQVVSPIQAILDCEYIRMLRRYLKEYEVSDESIGFETIREVGPGGSFIAAEHTARRYRDELWEPRLWQRDMLPVWETKGRRNDVDYALDVYRDLAARAMPPNELSEHEERELMKIVRREESRVS